MKIRDGKLSDVAVKNAKAGEKPAKLADGRGLYLLVNPNGSKLWRLKYRFEAKEKLLAFGAYPAVMLTKARKLTLAAREQLAAGTDPGAVKAEAKAVGKAAAANTFEAVAREWLAKQNLAPTTHGKSLWLLEAILFPWIGSKPVAGVKSSELLATLRLTEARGKLETAQRAKQLAGRVFRYAIATDRAENDPAAALKGALKAPVLEHHPSLVDPDRIGGLLRAIEGYEGTLPVACALKLAPMLFVRPGELRQAEWSEFDLDSAEWRIPAEKMKMRVTHIVPLASQAVAILRDLHPLTGSGRYVFPHIRGIARPMSEGTVLAALRRMGYTGDEMTGHGFRSMASTRMNEMGWNPDWIELQLAHADGTMRGDYNYAKYLPGRREMMQAWADYLDRLRDGGNVVAGKFGKAAA